MIRTFICAGLLLVLSACGVSDLNSSELLNPSPLFEEESDIARTFAAGTLLLPATGDGEPVITRPGQEDIWRPYVSRYGGPMPAVVYLHGCTGLRNLQPLEALARAGFVVIAPDSFARRFRPLQCQPSRQTGGANLYVYDFRMTEISYALQRIADYDWIDRRRLFLLGVSEGGLAAALYRGDDFRGRVIAQWTCHGRPLVQGIGAPPGEPILAIVRSGDPWYAQRRTAGQTGDCGAFIAGRPRSRSIVLTGEGGHDVFSEASIVQTVIEFFRSLGA